MWKKQGKGYKALAYKFNDPRNLEFDNRVLLHRCL